MKNRNACYCVIMSIFWRALQVLQIMFSRELHVSLAKKKFTPWLGTRLIKLGSMYSFVSIQRFLDMKRSENQKNTKHQTWTFTLSHYSQAQSQSFYSFLFGIISGEWLHIHLAYASLHKFFKAFQSVHHATPTVLSPSCFSLSLSYCLCTSETG